VERYLENPPPAVFQPDDPVLTEAGAPPTSKMGANSIISYTLKKTFKNLTSKATRK
jgi:hypothetical protein